MNRKLLAILLALMLLPSLGAMMEQAPAAEDPALATLNGVDITKSQVDELIPGFLERQYIADASDYRSVLEVIIRREVMKKKIADMGFDVFTPEEDEAFRAEAQQQWDEALGAYADYYQSDDSQEARDAALKQAEEYYLADGVTLERILEDTRSNASVDRMSQYLLADYEPTQEEVQKVFQEIGAIYQQYYENDIAQYEYMTQYSGQTSWYTPAGYRGIVHILLTVPEELSKEYQRLNAALEEQQQAGGLALGNDTAEEGADTAGEADAEATAEPAAEPVTPEMVEAARQAVLASRQADIDMIYSRLERGDSFLDLIGEYGEDPGMAVEANLRDGYPVHASSIVYDPAFTQAAFSDAMQQVGDVSRPAVGSFGIHILQYLRDVPSGLILTADIQQEIEDYLVSVKQNEVFNTAFDSWITQETLVYHDEAISKATEEALANAQSPEELPLEAVPSDEDGEEAEVVQP